MLQLHAPLASAAALDETLGALYVGLVFSAVMYGMTSWQVFQYQNSYQGDRMYMKALVGTVFLLETTHQALILHAVYIYLMSKHLNPIALEKVVWSIVAEVMVNGAIALLVQLFFVFRVWNLSQRSYFFSAPIAVMSLAEFSVITGYVIKAAPLTDYTEVGSLKSLSLAVNVLSAATDVCIALVLCYLLQQSRTGFRRMDVLITKLIVFTVNTGLLTSLDAIASLISFLVVPDTYIYIAFFFVLGRLYSNSLLLTLNVRHSLSGRSSGTSPSCSIPIQEFEHYISFAEHQEQDRGVDSCDPM